MDFITVLKAPAFIINLDRSPERLTQSIEQITQAGFEQIIRWKATDARENLENVWMEVINKKPQISTVFNDYEVYPNSVGCLLSHLRLWKYIIQENIELATIFEDDVLFHSEWQTLAPKLWDKTPRDYDILYIGANSEGCYHETNDIVKIPVMCTHAYIITLNGAKQLFDSITTHPLGYYAIDGMLFDIMLNILLQELSDKYLEYTREYTNYIYQLVKIRGLVYTSRVQRNIVLKKFSPFKWYVWNTKLFTESRSIGIVVQDLNITSMISPC